MKTKKVNRYYCDFCKKAGCSGGHMKKHEERCTLNPNRICGMCKTLDNEQVNLKELIALLPNIKEFEHYDSEHTHFCHNTEHLNIAVKEPLKKIREKTDNCPACILAALRQAKIPVPLVTGFDFKKECESFWNDFNDSRTDTY